MADSATNDSLCQRKEYRQTKLALSNKKFWEYGRGGETPEGVSGRLADEPWVSSEETAVPLFDFASLLAERDVFRHVGE